MEIFKLFGSIFVNTDDAENSIQKTSDKAESFASKLGSGIKTATKWGTAIATAAVTATSVVSTALVGMASEYDTAFAQVNTLLTGSAEEVETYKQEVLDASSQMGVSTEEYCDAVYSAISAGQDQADAIAFTNQALKLAEGGFTDASTAVDVLTTALNAYGMESDQVSTISDMLITTQNLGKTTVDELAASMGKIIPTANAYGVQIDDLCGMYATMTSNGIATAESTTYMNSMLNELGKSGTKASGILREMTEHIQEGGMSFAEMMDAGWELSDVLSLLDEYAADNGLAMMDLFGSAEAGKAAQVLWTNAEQLNDAVTAMGDSAGATEEAYSTMTETLSFKMDKLKTQFKNIGISLGEALMPTAMKLADMASDFMPTIQNLAEQLAPTLINVCEQLVPPLMNLAGELLPPIFDLLSGIMPVITEIALAIMPVIVQLMQTLLPPIIEITNMIAPLIAELLPPLIGLLQPIISLLSPLIELVMVLLSPLIELLNLILPPLISVMTEVVQVVADLLQPAIEFLAEIIENYLNGALISIIPVMESVWDFLSVTWGWIQEKIGTVISWISDNIVERFTLIHDTIVMVAMAISSKFGEALSGMWASTKSVVNWIIGGFEQMVNGVIKSINKILDGINTVVDGVGNLIGLDWEVPTLKEISLPRLKKGTVVNRPTIAEIGEDGTEAVVPLENNTQWIRRVAEELQLQIAGAGAPALAADKADEILAKLEIIISVMMQYLPKLANMVLVTDTGALVGELAEAMDAELGIIANREDR